MGCQVNGESLLGTRHKHAMDVMKSLRDSVLFLVCDGYCHTSVSQSVPAKVNQGHELQCQGREIATKTVSPDGGAVVQSTEVVPNTGQGLAVQGHETVADKVVEGQGLVFQVTEKVNGVGELTADEQWRERARQRRMDRLARYCLSHQVLPVLVSEMPKS